MFARLVFALLLCTPLAAQARPSYPGQQFVKRVKGTVEQHNWGKLLRLTDTTNRRIQLGQMRIGKPQYLAEILGLHNVGNSIKTGTKLTYSDLNRIRTLKVDRSTLRSGSVRGKAILQDGAKLDVNFLITKPKKRYVLTGGVG
jgi:hypothetical protein